MTYATFLMHTPIVARQYCRAAQRRRHNPNVKRLYARSGARSVQHSAGDSSGWSSHAAYAVAAATNNNESFISVWGSVNTTQSNVCSTFDVARFALVKLKDFAELSISCHVSWTGSKRQASSRTKGRGSESHRFHPRGTPQALIHHERDDSVQ